MDSNQSLHSKEWGGFADDERHQLQSNGADYIHLKARIRHSNQCTLSQMEVKSKACRKEARLELSVKLFVVLTSCSAWEGN